MKPLSLVILTLIAGLAIEASAADKPKKQAKAEKAITEWLEAGLPTLREPSKPAPFEVLNLRYETNHADQQFLKSDYRRRSLITTLAAEVKLVVIPANGGRYAAYGDRSMTISPRSSGTVYSIPSHLFNYKGQISGGARVYLEMRIDSPFNKGPVHRISNVYWAGTPEQLAEAMKKGPALRIAGKTAGPESAELPDDIVIPEGSPVWLEVGTRWRPATVWETSEAGEKVQVLAYLGRPGKLFESWFIDVDRKRLRIENVALEDLKADKDAFAQRFENRNRRFRGAAIPETLVSAAEKEVKAGQRLIYFNWGGLGSVEATGPVKDGVVEVKPLKGGKVSKRRADELYIDPNPTVVVVAKPPTTPSVTKTEVKSSLTITTTKETAKPVSSLTDDWKVVTAKTKLAKGDILKTKWGSRWWDVQVLDLLENGEVKVHWVGWSTVWDGPKKRDILYFNRKESRKRKGNKNKKDKSSNGKKKKAAKKQEAKKEENSD